MYKRSKLLHYHVVCRQKLFLLFNYSIKIANRVRNFVFSDKSSTQSIFYYTTTGFPYGFKPSSWIEFGHVIKKLENNNILRNVPLFPNQLTNRYIWMGGGQDGIFPITYFLNDPCSLEPWLYQEIKIRNFKKKHGIEDCVYFFGILCKLYKNSKLSYYLLYFRVLYFLPDFRLRSVSGLQ